MQKTIAELHREVQEKDRGIKELTQLFEFGIKTNTQLRLENALRKERFGEPDAANSNKLGKKGYTEECLVCCRSPSRALPE